MSPEEHNVSEPAHRSTTAKAPFGSGAAASAAEAVAAHSRNDPDDARNAPLRKARITPPRFGPVSATVDSNSRRQRAGMLLRALAALEREDQQAPTQALSRNDTQDECPNATRGITNAQVKKEGTAAVLRALAALQKQTEAVKNTPVLPADPFNDNIFGSTLAPYPSPSPRFDGTVSAPEEMSSGAKLHVRSERRMTSTSQTIAQRWRRDMRIYWRGQRRREVKTERGVGKLGMRHATSYSHTLRDELAVIAGFERPKPVHNAPRERIRASAHRRMRVIEEQETAEERRHDLSQIWMAAAVLILALIIMTIVVGCRVNFNILKKETAIVDPKKETSTPWKNLEDEAKEFLADPNRIGYKLRKAFEPLAFNIRMLRSERAPPERDRREDIGQKDRAPTEYQTQEENSEHTHREHKSQQKDTSKHKYHISDPYPYTYIANIFESSKPDIITLQSDNSTS